MSQTPDQIEGSQSPEASPLISFPTPFTLNELFGGKVFSRIDSRLGTKYYNELAIQTLRPVVIHHPDGSTEFCIIAPPVNGKAINLMLYLIAPYKEFGLDTDDILKDWRNLYDDTDNENRRKAHARFPGWELFEEHRLAFREAILAHKEGRTGPEFTPIIRWVKEGDTRFWRLNDQLPDSIQVTAAPTNALLGLVMTGIYATDATDQWPTYYGYQGENGKTQPMGPTQSLPLAIIFSDSLKNSKTLARLEEYCVTGVLPTPINISVEAMSQTDEEEISWEESGFGGFVLPVISTLINFDDLPPLELPPDILQQFSVGSFEPDDASPNYPKPKYEMGISPPLSIKEKILAQLKADQESLLNMDEIHEWKLKKKAANKFKK